VHLTLERFDLLASEMNRRRIAVVGDVMLDRYLWGTVERISPEAPVPVVLQTGESLNLGGAANVAANVASLGASALLVGLIGDDPSGRQLLELVEKSGFEAGGILISDDRPTSVKTRVIAHGQHVVRIDRESTAPIDDATAANLLNRLALLLEGVDAFILEDYNKGLLTPQLIRGIITLAKERGIPVGVDPKHTNFWEYKGATLFKPNLRELQTALGRSLGSEELLVSGAREARDRLEVEHLLVTRGESGMALVTGQEVDFIPTRARRVHDVSGAGDTVIATLITALAAGANVFEAAHIANHAAGVVIAELGAVPIQIRELRRVVGQPG